MNRFDAGRLTAVLAAAAAAAGCHQNRDWQASNTPARVCVDDQGRRMPDEDCAQRRGGSRLWYYFSGLNRGARPPPLGGRVSGGSVIPTAGLAYRDAPGGVLRGGFGAIGAKLFRAGG